MDLSAVPLDLDHAESLSYMGAGSVVLPTSAGDMAMVRLRASSRPCNQSPGLEERTYDFLLTPDVARGIYQILGGLLYGSKSASVEQRDIDGFWVSDRAVDPDTVERTVFLDVRSSPSETALRDDDIREVHQHLHFAPRAADKLARMLNDYGEQSGKQDADEGPL